MVVALHYGTVIYGNIGAADRLDFTVIGPSVNLVSRIEAVAKSLDLPWSSATISRARMAVP
jgi:adenylate cyclase